MPITSLNFTNVGPFDDVEFEFDPQVNVFTGPNNSGKSTALMVLGDIVAYPFTLPRKLLRNSNAEFEIHTKADTKKSGFRGPLPVVFDDLDFWYTEAARQWDGVLKELGYAIFIPALRRGTDFRSKGPGIKLPSLPLKWYEEDQGGDPGVRVTGSEYLRREALFATNASSVSDEAVIEKIIELDYRAYRQDDPVIRNIIEKVAACASEITDGFPIHFLRVGEDARGLFPLFQTPDGDTSLSVFSQGTQSIIQWLAYLLIGYAEYYGYPANLEEKPGILIIDEIDAHLHPSWQRRIIPTLTKYFPNLQIFCSTHSPLMLAGLKEGQVHLLRRDEKGKVTVSRNETDIIGWSADEILRNLLDVPSPTDLETVWHLERLQELRRREKLLPEEAEELEQLRHTVNLDLLGGPMAAELDRLAELLKEARAHVSSRSEPSPSTEARSTRRRRKPSDSCTG